MGERDLFSPADLDQLEARGITPAEAAGQIELLRDPPAAVVLDRPCRVGDGILALAPEAQRKFALRGSEVAHAGRVTKFVPASGAATRMFKDLIAAQEDRRRPSLSSAAVRELFENLDAFPFSEEVRRRSGVRSAPATETEEREILRVILDELGYSRIPKGLIPFHRAERVRTPFEEHLLEAVQYARAEDGIVRAHFTVAPESRDEFERLLATIRPTIERDGCLLSVSFSVQHPSTDTLAIDEGGAPFRKDDGTLLFRPGGHGALLHNLGALGADIVSIKNIDNVVPAEASGEVVRWKQILIGFLADLERQSHDLLAACSAADPSESVLDEALDFAATRLLRRPQPFGAREEKRRFVVEALDRPLRVCGVVRNDGEPGGAPFWVRSGDATRSIQIVEGSQVDLRSREQVEIFESSTHFNPVDVVCSLRSWRGEPHELERFIDPAAVFISVKSHEGRELRALERPGLWNGAMAHWNTICVEVPAETFAPVKTVLDLLRPQHQSVARERG